MATKIKRGVIRYAVREVIGTIFVAIILFWTAGSVAWTAGWVLIGVYLGWISATIWTVSSVHPQLLAERVKRKLSDQRWDQIILSVFGVMVIVKYIVAGFDQRFGWTVGFPAWLQLLGFILAVTGYALVTWAMVANAFFTLVVEHQEKRGHSVATGGPYRLIRHPGYLGTVLFEVGSPLLLASLWALLPGLVSLVLMVLRTGLEDQFLHRNLEGYADYAGQTPYRLIPGIW